MFKGNRSGMQAAGSRPAMVVESLEGRRLFASDYHVPVPGDLVEATGSYVQPQGSDAGMMDSFLKAVANSIGDDAQLNGLGDDAQLNGVGDDAQLKESVEKLDPTAVEYYAKAEPPVAP